MARWALFRRREPAAPPDHRRAVGDSAIGPDFVVFMFAVELAIVSTITAIAIGISVR
jgi:hypothetical protein